jgi:F-type H+/Na+-transporting ATPase subunit alpha
MIDAATTKEIGIVQATKQYLVSIQGLPSVRVHDVVVHQHGMRGIVTSLTHDVARVMMLDQGEVKPGQQFDLTQQINQLSLGEHLFGRVINPLGDPIDGASSFPTRNANIVLDKDAGDLASREQITQQLETGFIVVDTLLPIGVGQRQLLMGPVQSGTGAFVQRVIEHQTNTGVVCVYAAIGKSAVYVRRMADALFATDAKKNTVIVASFSHDTAPLNTITPAVALQVAEFFCDRGKDVLLILDDMYTQAKYLREISLLEGRLPGRDSYPGDIFYQQAHLIERAGNFLGKGSITMLPVLQNDIEGDVDLITTNVMGTTDGHVSFSPSLASQGKFPPIVVDASVTRVGKHTQSIVQKQMATRVTQLLTEAEEQERFGQFGTRITEHGKSIIAQAHIIRQLMDQEETARMSKSTQAILLALPLTSFMHDAPINENVRMLEQLSVIIASDVQFQDLHKMVFDAATLEDFLKEVEKNHKKLKIVCQK